MIDADTQTSLEVMMLAPLPQRTQMCSTCPSRSPDLLWAQISNDTPHLCHNAKGSMCAGPFIQAAQAAEIRSRRIGYDPEGI